MQYNGKNVAMLFSTCSISLPLFMVLKRLKVTIDRLIKIKILPPKMAIRFGVIPHVEMRNKMADIAMALTIIVTKDRINNIVTANLLSEFFEVSVIEKSIIAITPIKSILKIKRKFLSLYGFLPFAITANK